MVSLGNKPTALPQQTRYLIIEIISYIRHNQ
jgi:hypothetical protein